jgi:DnaK suppressor protein
MTQPPDTAFPTAGEEVPVSKPTAKTAAAPKAPAKAPATPAKPSAAAAAPAKPSAAVAPTKVAAKAAPAPAPAPTPAAKPAASKPGNVKPSAKTAPQNQLPTMAPAPYTNRFTDRFAPAAPASRQMTEAADIPKATRKIDPKLANAWKSKPGRELTVEELLAMPDAEYMNDKQLDFFRAQLQKQKDDLLSNAGETTEHLREDTSIVPDPADRATIEEEHALELRTRDRERKLLKKIAQSLGRLESGDYGFCDETGEPIGLARLLARPTATLSLEAQQRRELKQKMFGD